MPSESKCWFDPTLPSFHTPFQAQKAHKAIRQRSMSCDKDMNAHQLGARNPYRCWRLSCGFAAWMAAFSEHPADVSLTG